MRTAVEKCEHATIQRAFELLLGNPHRAMPLITYYYYYYYYYYSSFYYYYYYYYYYYAYATLTLQ